MIATSHLVLKTEAYDLSFEIKGRLTMAQRRNIARTILRDLYPRFRFIGCIRIYHRDGRNLSFFTAEERYLDENPLIGPTLSTHRGKFGFIVRMRRLSLGLTQEELAHLVGMTRSHISRLERGRYNPHLATIRRLEHALAHTLPRVSMKDLTASPHNHTFAHGQCASSPLPTTTHDLPPPTQADSVIPNADHTTAYLATHDPSESHVTDDQIDGLTTYEAIVNPSGISWDTEAPEYEP
jgi:transcriptional regulator with XRE-family HTH domain